MSEQIVIKSAKSKGFKVVVALLISFIIFCIVGFIGGIYFLISYSIKNSEPYQMSLSLAAQNPIIQQYIGHPIKTSYFILGSMETSLDGNGKVNVSFSVSGPKGKGKIYIKAIREFGVWKYNKLILVPKKGKKPIDLTRNQ